MAAAAATTTAAQGRFLLFLLFLVALRDEPAARAKGTETQALQVRERESGVMIQSYRSPVSRVRARERERKCAA